MFARGLAMGVVLMALAVPALAQGTADDSEKKLRENPNDTSVMDAYMGTKIREISVLVRTNPDEALKKVEELIALLATIEPSEEDAKQLLGQAQAVANSMKDQIALQKMPLEELVAKLKENPGDVRTLSLYGQKVMQTIGPLARSQPEEAEAKLKEARELLAKISESGKDDAEFEQALNGINRTLDSLQRAIESAIRLAALVGQDATELAVEAWVNGEALTDADLKGKVVLLDFWAVWCGPCIATFPHLREWQENYSDKGLVIIGVTNYYNFAWDEEAGRANRSQEQVSPEDEQAMLVKFAEQHQLQHRFALEKDRVLSEYYAVTGIPQVVLVDRVGKIRLVKVGSGPDNARAIDEMIQQLLEEKASAGS